MEKNDLWLVAVIICLCIGFFFAGLKWNVTSIDVKYNNLCYEFVYEHCSCSEGKIRTIGMDAEYPDVNLGFNWSYPYQGPNLVGEVNGT